MELDGPDLFHLVQEGPGHPSHTLKIAVLDGPVDHDRVRDWVIEAAGRLEVLRRVPDQPTLRPARWVGSESPPAERIRRHQLPTPGAEADFVDLLSVLCGERLRLDAPPWCVHHVTGLDGGRDAVVLRIHHSLADGGASSLLLEQLAGSGTAIDRPAPPPAPMVTSTRHLVRQARGLPPLMRRWGAYAKRSAADEVGLADPFAGPMTRYNRHRSGADRRCSFVTLPLHDVRDAAHAHQAHVSEVLLSLCGGAIHRHLTALGETPDAPLTTNVPLGLPERKEPYGNATTSYGVGLHSDVKDAGVRLAAICRDFRSVRELVAEDPRLLPDSMRYPRLYQLLLAGMHAQEKRKGRPAFNFIVSSVRGPGPLVICGVPVNELRSVGPLSGRFGLNITAWSYGDNLSIGLHTYADAADHLHDLGPEIRRELAALTASA